MRSPYFRSSAGYSLVELLVAITVLSILVLGMAQYNSSNKIQAQDVENASQQFLTLLREARSLAASSASATVDTTSGTENVSPEVGFGFFFDISERKAYVFADINASPEFNNPASADPFDSTEHVKISESGVFKPYIEVIAEKHIPPSTTTLVADTHGAAADQQDFWLIFGTTTSTVTFGTTHAVTMEDAAEIRITIGVPDIKAYTVTINKISRFLELNLTSL